MSIEERVANLEQAIKDEERLSSFERRSIRFTAFILLEFALLALIVWSVIVFHQLCTLISFVKFQLSVTLDSHKCCQ